MTNDKALWLLPIQETNFDLDELPFLLFEKISLSDLNCLPSLTDALVVHTFRCAYQNAWI